jgi:hypothetical protein
MDTYRRVDCVVFRMTKEAYAVVPPAIGDFLILGHPVVAL